MMTPSCNHHLLLSTKSPRRQALLQQIGVDYELVAVACDEVIDPSLTPAENVQNIALQKAQTTSKLYPNRRILSADTLVVVQGKILGKPKDQLEAIRMLRELSGNTHQVLTGVVLIDEKGVPHSAVSISQVRFKVLLEAEIRDYVNTGEPMDKAGAYAIQGLAARFIERIEGSYSGIMGLPLFETAQLLEGRSPEEQCDSSTNQLK